MISIIAGTNRPQSRTLQVAHLVKGLLDKHGIAGQIIDLQKISFKELDGNQYKINKPVELSDAIEKLHKSQGYIVIAPEYNGSLPGILKYFIDHWEYPKTFEYMPVAFVGLGGRFGGVRPIEHLQQIFSYRNGFLFPERVFLFNVWELMKSGTIEDELTLKLLENQALDFSRFINALIQAKLHGQSRG
jgi:chromate reductase, NAD(P)H dehydrogenase (quinone)